VMKQAIDMSPDERRERMRGLRRRVLTYDVHRWATSFLDDLARAREDSEAAPPRTHEGLTKLTMTFLAQAKRASELVLILDYDDTLVPFADTPELARPDPELMSLLAALATRPKTRVHIASGRTRDYLERWFGRLPLSLHAEHGFWTRESPESQWVPIMELPGEW